MVALCVLIGRERLIGHDLFERQYLIAIRKCVIEEALVRVELFKSGWVLTKGNPRANESSIG
jgi:hypothetical protein